MQQVVSKIINYIFRASCIQYEDKGKDVKPLMMLLLLLMLNFNVIMNITVCSKLHIKALYIQY